MRTSLLLEVLCCIAMIGAVPIGNRAPAEVIGRRQNGVYVPWQQLMEVPTRLKTFLQLTWSKIPRVLLTFRHLGEPALLVPGGDAFRG
jgi:hypothetical protein